MFTAQEMLVGESSYPTEKIGENARAYRQLGLGYANLGALLMARGLAVRLRRGPRLGGRAHRDHDRPRVPHVGQDRRGHGAVRGLRAERRRDAPRDPQAPGGGRRDRRRAGARGHAVGGQAVLGRGDLARRAARVPQRPGVGPRADRHDRPDDGLRHDRHRARARARQDEEARGRRHDAVREPDRAARARQARIRRGADRGHRRVHRRAQLGRRGPAPARGALLGLRHRDGGRSRSTTWATCG